MSRVHTSLFAEFNYPRPGVKKRPVSASSSPSQPTTAAPAATRRTDERRPSPVAAPMLRRYRAQSSPVALGSPSSSGNLHSTEAIPIKRTPTTQPTTAPVRNSAYPTSSRTPSPTTEAARPVADKDQSLTASRPPWDFSRHGRSSHRSHSKPRRFSSPSLSQSSGGATPATAATSPSAPRTHGDTARTPLPSEGHPTRRTLSTESAFLTPHIVTPTASTTADVSGNMPACADGSCMHSRRSIVEFIEMQRELRRCYAAMEAHENEVSALRDALAKATATLEARSAQNEAWVHEREKELLVELARREQDIRAEAWEQARATVSHRTEEATTHLDAATQTEEVLNQSHVAHHTSPCGWSSEKGTGNGDRCEPSTDEDTEAEERQSQQEALIADMRRTMFQLEDALERERDDRLVAVRALEQRTKEREQLQTHIRLLSAWKEEHEPLVEQAREEPRVACSAPLDAASTSEQRAALPCRSPLPITRGDDEDVGARGDSGLSPISTRDGQTPLQKLFAHSLLTLSPSPTRTPPQMHPRSLSCGPHDNVEEGSSPGKEGGTTDVKSSPVSVRRSPTPSRPAPAAPSAEQTPMVQEEAAATGPSTGHNPAHTPSPSLAASEARCRELLRALLDKERQLAEIAAERTAYRRWCEDLRGSGLTHDSSTHVTM